MGQAFDEWEKCAHGIDATPTWQVVYGSCQDDSDSYEIEVVSKGPIPRLPLNAFGDLVDSVTIDVDPEDDSHITVHCVKYLGGLAGMQMFTQTLVTELNHGAEGDVNPIKDFVSRNPFWLINAAMGVRE